MLSMRYAHAGADASPLDPEHSPGGQGTMTRARDVMTGSLITCSRDDSVADAARLMRDRNTGYVLVTDNDKLHRIVTDRDIAIRLTARGLDPSLVRVRDVMSKHVVTGQ